MLNWLNSLLNFFGGGLRAIGNWVLSVVTTVYQQLHKDDVTIIDYAHGLANSLNRMSAVFSAFTNDYYFPFVKWTEGEVSTLGSELYRDYNQLVKDINAVSKQSTQNYTVIDNSINSDIANLIKWIISTIFNPLLSKITGALTWIGKEGAYVLDLLTHLDKLADLVMAFIWLGWLGLFKKYFKSIVVFIFHNWKSWIPAILPIIEDIITSVF